MTILAHADNIIILSSNTQIQLIQTMEKLIQAIKEMRLIVDEAKTKYMNMS